MIAAGYAVNNSIVPMMGKNEDLIFGMMGTMLCFIVITLMNEDVICRVNADYEISWSEYNAPVAIFFLVILVFGCVGFGGFYSAIIAFCTVCMLNPFYKYNVNTREMECRWIWVRLNELRARS